jgi:hypothetical protein
MASLNFDDTDYSVVVKNRAVPPKSWRWEIYRVRQISLYGLKKEASTSRRRPTEHLARVLVQNTQAIGILGQVQRNEERLRFRLHALQISGDVRNTIEPSVRIVQFSNAEEFDSEFHVVAEMAIVCRAASADAWPAWVAAFRFRLGFLG